MMKQTVNFYQEKYRPHFVWLTLSHLFLVSIFALMLLVIIKYAIGMRTSLLQTQLNEAQNNLSNQQQISTEMTNLLTMRQKDPKLLAAAQSLKTIVSEKERLLVELKRLEDVKTNDFPSMFTSLAQLANEELWITQFGVIDNEIKIQGNLLDPTALPIWIRGLSTTEYFVNRSFNDAKISVNNEQLSFLIATSKPGVGDIEVVND